MTTDSEGEESSFDFAGLAEHDEFAETVPETVPDTGTAGAVPATAPTAETAAPSLIPSQVTATPPAPPPAATPAAPVVPPVEQPPQVPQTPAAATTPATAPAEPALTFEQHKAAFLPKIAELYKLTDEEAEAFRTNPGEALPKLAAQLHYEVQAATFNAVMQNLPALFDALTERRSQVEKYDQMFYDKWPALKGDDKKTAVISAVKAYKAANPNAPVETVVAQAGLMAALSLGIPLEQLMPQQQQQAPSAPSMAPAMPRPAGVGAGGPVAPPQPRGAEGNIFADLAEDFMQHGI